MSKVGHKLRVYVEQELGNSRLSADYAPGDIIHFTEADRENGIRSGSFATVERSVDDNTLAARLDSGKAVQLDTAQPRHLD